MKFYTLLLAAACISGGCSKSDDRDTDPALNNGWQVNTEVFQVKEATLRNTQLYAYDSLGNRARVTFRATPRESGTYRIVKTRDLSVEPLKNDEATVDLLFRTGKQYWSTGTEQQVLTVTFSLSGVSTTVMPKLWVKSNTSSDSLQVRASITTAD